MEVSKTINLQLTVNHKDGGFVDEASMLRWLAACLNSNENFAQVSIAALPAPIVVVDFGEGLIQHVNASAPVRLIVLNEDTDEVAGNEVREINGSAVFISDYAPVKVDVAYVEHTAQEVDSVEELDVPKVSSESIIQ